MIARVKVRFGGFIVSKGAGTLLRMGHSDNTRLTVEELVEVLDGLPGRMVEANVSVEDGARQVSSFSGRVEKVVPNATPTDHWTVWWKDEAEGPLAPTVILWREGFEGAEVKGPA